MLWELMRGVVLITEPEQSNSDGSMGDSQKLETADSVSSSLDRFLFVIVSSFSNDLDRDLGYMSRSS